MRQQTQSLGVVVHGAGKVAELLACHSAHLPCVGDERMALDGGSGVGLGAAEVVEVELGDGAVQVGPGKLGLGIHHLVEILDGKYVVLKVHSIAAHIHHLVGVDLGAACNKGTQRYCDNDYPVQKPA